MEPILKLEKCLNVLMGDDRRLTLQTIRYLLKVHLKPGIPITELGSSLGDSAGMASRYVQLLSDGGKATLRNGLEWVQIEVDPDHALKRNLYLTSQGQKIIKQVKDILGE